MPSLPDNVEVFIMEDDNGYSRVDEDGRFTGDIIPANSIHDQLMGALL